MIYALIFALATLADVLTTNLVLSKGGRESNGIVAWFMARLSRFWWLPKALLAAVFFWSTGAWPAVQYGVGVAAAFTALVAARNYVIYRRM